MSFKKWKMLCICFDIHVSHFRYVLTHLPHILKRNRNIFMKMLKKDIDAASFAKLSFF